MSRSKPPRSGTGGATRPARTRRPRPDLAAAVQAVAPSRAELSPETMSATVSAAAFVAAAQAEPARPATADGASRADAPPAPDTTAEAPPAPDDMAALSLSVLDFYRQAAEAQFTFWSALMNPDRPDEPGRDDEAA